MDRAVDRLSREEAEEIARGFAEPDGRDSAPYRMRIHARDGLVAATDGRILARIAAPAARAIEGSMGEVLDFLAEQRMEEVAPWAWLEGAAPRLEEARDRRMRAAEAVAEDDRRTMRERTRKCPHCGEPVVVDDDFEVLTPEAYGEQEMIEEPPDAREVCRAARIAWRDGRGEWREALGNVHYLLMGIGAARRLGGATLVAGRRQMALRGDGWEVLIAMVLPDFRGERFDVELVAPGARAEEEEP